MSVSVGIDLGTTFSAVAYIDPKTRQPAILPNREGGRITPSVIQFIDGKPVFGTEAESAFQAGKAGCAASFKRSMGKREPHCIINGVPYTAEALSALLLNHLKEDAESALGDTIEDAVITVPAYFYSPEREATIRAAEAAGLRVRKIIDEPNAAAMAYGLNNWRENANILVYDLGGGTFDVTLTRMDRNGELNTVATRGDHYLGGRDWDARVEALLFEKFSDEIGEDIPQTPAMTGILRGVSESVKKQLTAMITTKVTVAFPQYGRVSITVEREEFERLTADLITRTGALCQAVLAESGLTACDVTDILLVGGSTRMPQVSAYIEETLGKKPISHVNPDEAVALGAAIQATKGALEDYTLSIQVTENGKKVTDRSMTGLHAGGALQQRKVLSDISLIKLREATAHALGMIAVSPDGKRYINDIIIPANHPRPVRAAKAFHFYTSAKGQNEMEIFVLQGDQENPLDCQLLYRYVVMNIQHIAKQKGETAIKVQYRYDNNGVIHVEARQEDETENLPIRREPVPEDMRKYAYPIAETDLFRPEPISVIMAIDVSGSMEGAPLRDAQDAMCDFVRQLDFSYTRVGIVAVSDHAAVVAELTDSEDCCIHAIRSISCGQTGYGNSAHPLSYG